MSESTLDPALEALGWTPHWQELAGPKLEADDGLAVARVAEDLRSEFVLASLFGRKLSECRPELLRDARKGKAVRPVVGDWVLFRRRPDDRLDEIFEVLPRRGVFARKKARGQLAEQVVAANVDWLFIITALVGDFSVRRIERYLTLAHEAGAKPVLILSKADLVEADVGDLQARLAEVREVAGGAPVIPSRADEASVRALEPYLQRGQTVALLGSSGVGKSTLMNRLLGGAVVHHTQGVRRDGKGRHTTTTRIMRQLESGALVIDTPGMRELGLWQAESGIQDAFEDIVAIARHCRFNDCMHDREPGCAVRAAIEAGRLDPKRLESYRTLRAELAEVTQARARRKRRR